MIRYFTAKNGKLVREEKPCEGCWISVTEPTPMEIQLMIDRFGLDKGFVNSSLDEEESSRIEREDDQTLIIVDTPVSSVDDGQSQIFFTLPIGIIITEEHVITISLKRVKLLEDAENGIIRDLRPNFKTRFVLQLLLRIASQFLFYLKQIDKISSAAEKQLHNAMKNELLMQLLALEKSLVYFSTSLKANEGTIEKIFRGRVLKLYDEDQDLVEDVLIEMKQAIEMSSIYTQILSSMMDGFSSVISNNQNIVMWQLTIVTVIMEIPNIIFAFYGINTGTLPIAATWYFPVVLTIGLMTLATIILMKWKKK